MQFPFNLAQNKELDVIGFGTNAVDYLIQVPEYPAFNSKIELTDYTQAAGGEVATAMAGLRRLGRKIAYIGRFGTDAAGDFGLQSLRDEGVDLQYAEQIDGARTQIAFIVIDERSGERTVIWQRDKKLSYDAAEAPLEAVRRAKVLHFTPHDVKACLAMAKRAKADGVIVSVDIDNLFEGVQELLSYVDIFIASADFPKKLFGTRDRREALREIKSLFGCGIVGVTLGEAGSLLLCGDQLTETPGFAVPGGCRDTTGAGDAFRVGLLHGLLAGSSVEESAAMANAVAALKCRKIGARTALPTQAELTRLLKKS
ncbi:MAG: carbohydrate kinase family protein [Pyrinomonadaceae bacterium]